jgi:hypothetical protein
MSESESERQPERFFPPIEAGCSQMDRKSESSARANHATRGRVEGMEPQTSVVPDASQLDTKSRPTSVETIRRKGGVMVAHPQYEQADGKVMTVPSTPSATSPLPSPALSLPTGVVPPEASESKAMPCHQSFYIDHTSSDEEPDPESPVLIATSVNFLVPTTRPNLISITPSPFQTSYFDSRSIPRNEVATPISIRRSTKSIRIHGSVKNYSRPRVEKKHKRKTSSLSSTQSFYSTHDMPTSPSTCSQYSMTPSAHSSAMEDPDYAPEVPQKDPTSGQLDRSATIRVRAKRNRKALVHDRTPSHAGDYESFGGYPEQIATGYPEVGTWSRRVVPEGRHVYSRQSDVPPVPPLTPTSIPVASSPSWAGTPTTESTSISPTMHYRDHYQTGTTSDRRRGDDNFPPSHSSHTSVSDVVRVKSLRRRKHIYTSERPNSLRSLPVDTRGNGGADSPCSSSSVNNYSPAYQSFHTPSRKSLPFPYQHIYKPIPALASSSTSSFSDRPASIRSMQINHNNSVTSLAHTNANTSTSNLSIYSSYTESEDPTDTGSRYLPSDTQRITRKKSMKFLRDNGETMVGRVMGKGFMNFNLGSWKKKNPVEASSHRNGSIASTMTSYEQSVVN